MISEVPIVTIGQVHPVVEQVRFALNMPGGRVLDREMAEIIRGVQKARGVSPTGDIDERLLGWFGITAF